MSIIRNILLAIVVFGYAITGACFAQEKPFVLSQVGIAKAAIVLPDDAPIADKTAANELAAYLKQITGADFPVYTHASSPMGMSRILIGQSEESRRLSGNIDWNKLKFDGIVIKFVGSDLVLAGDKPRGTLYAIYTFLEEYLGCRWWTTASSYIPSNPNLSVKRIDKTYVPPFMYRETYFAPVIHRNLEFASRLKLNGTHQSVPEAYGGHYNLIGFVHTSDRFLPAATYFKDHPEWYSLVNGKRVGGQGEGQLCLTNEEMKAEFVKQALKQIELDPSAGMIAIDQNDNMNYCQCDKCSAVAKEEGGQSGVLIRFVNSVADEIVKKYPNFLVETLAYQYTRHAPKLARPRDNVIVRLCSGECDFASPMSSKNNASFYKDIQDWKNMAKRLYIWDYVVDFANLSIGHPNWRALAPNIRIFAANHVVGVFEQGDGFNSDAVFGCMKTWVLSHLMWDPSQDQRKLMQEFASGYYGSAAPYLIKYLDLTCDAIEKSKIQLTCGIGDNLTYLKQKEMDTANDLFDKAELSVHNNPELLKRVKVARLALDHMWILKTQLNRTKVGAARGMDTKAVAEDFISRSDSTGNNYIHEAGVMTPDYYNNLRSLAVLPCIPESQRNPLIPKAAKGLKPDQWVDVQDSRMALYMLGTRSFQVADEYASDSKAARLPGNLGDWAAQTHLDYTGIPIGTKITMYVSVRPRIRAKSGIAFSTGIFDTINAKSIIDKKIMIEDIKDSKYHDYCLGTFTLRAGWYAYVAAPADDRQVEDVLIDRSFIVINK